MHLYAEDEVYLDASRSMLTITSTAGGYRSTIKLPRRSAVYDVFQRRLIAEAAEAFMADVPPLSTSLYFVGPKEEMKWLTERK